MTSLSNRIEQQKQQIEPLEQEVAETKIKDISAIEQRLDLTEEKLRNAENLVKDYIKYLLEPIEEKLRNAEEAIERTNQSITELTSKIAPYESIETFALFSLSISINELTSKITPLEQQVNENKKYIIECMHTYDQFKEEIEQIRKEIQQTK